MSHSWFNRYFNLKNKKEEEERKTFDEAFSCRRKREGNERQLPDHYLLMLAVDKAVRVSRYYLLRGR